MTSADRPQPPEDLDGEALLEWHRVSDELAAAGRLDKTDRAMLVLYVTTWAIYQDVMRHVTRFTSIVKHPNGVVGASPYYKVSRETFAQLRAVLNDMGLTYTSRPRSTPAENEALTF